MLNAGRRFYIDLFWLEEWFENQRLDSKSGNALILRQMIGMSDKNFCVGKDLRLFYKNEAIEEFFIRSSWESNKFYEIEDMRINEFCSRVQSE